MHTKIEKLVMVLWLIICLVILLLILVSSPAFAQGPSCEAASAEFEVLEVLPLAPAIPEMVSADSRPVGAFYQNRVPFSFEPAPGRKVVLGSTEDGVGCTRTDDWVEIQTSSGRVWNHDYRAPTRAEVWGIAPVDITYLFDPGEQEVTISLIDLTGPAHSSQPYYLLVVYDPTPSTATPPPSPTPSPTFTPSPVYTPSATPTITGVLVLTSSDPPAVSSGKSVLWPLSPFVLAGLVGGTILTLLFIISVGRQTLLPFGEIDLYEGSRWLATFSLNRFSRAMVTVGRQGDIAVAGESLPALAARIYARRGHKSQPETVIDLLDPADPAQVLETLPLQHGDSHVIGGSYRLVYRHYQPETSFIEEGDLYHA